MQVSQKISWSDHFLPYCPRWWQREQWLKMSGSCKSCGKTGHRGNHWWCQVPFVKAGGSESEQVGGTPESNPRRLSCYSDNVCTWPRNGLEARARHCRDASSWRSHQKNLLRAWISKLIWKWIWNTCANWRARSITSFQRMQWGQGPFKVIADYMVPLKTYFYFPHLGMIFSFLPRIRGCGYYWETSVGMNEVTSICMSQAKLANHLTSRGYRLNQRFGLKISHTHIHTHFPKRNKLSSRSALSKRCIE